MTETLDELVRELDDAAARLKSGELDSAAAAELVERCAELASRVGGELERQARAGAPGEPPGQETLL
jgi:hypothetical protein